MWDSSSRAERVVVIWGLILASSAVLYVAVSLSNLIFDNSANIASWVQAIGSISAIIATAIIARSDSVHRNHQLKIAENKERKLVAYDLNKSSILVSLHSFINSWRSFEMLAASEKVHVHFHEFKGLHFLKFTSKSFFLSSQHLIL